MTADFPLRRRSAPLPEAAWTAIDAEIRRAAVPRLSARALFGIDGPHGYDLAAVATGHTGAPREEGGLRWCYRTSQPLVEITATCTLDRAGLDDLARGAEDVDLEPLVGAVTACTDFEERLVYQGAPEEGGCPGMLAAAASAWQDGPRTIPAEADALLAAVAQVRASLAGAAAAMPGPYALVAGTRLLPLMGQIHAPTGRTVGELVGRMMDGGVRTSRGLSGGLVVALGGESPAYRLVIGQDLAAGYHHHDADTVTLELTETLTFRCLEPRAAIGIEVEG